MKKYCCETMKSQLTNQCEQHPHDCPDVVIVECKGTLTLIARNANYFCYYCPWCGTPHGASIARNVIDE